MQLSVITPCLNLKKTIERCVDSVLAAKLPGVEQVIVDGLSTDGTVEIIEKLKQKYGDSLRYISEKDNSMTEAMIKAVNMATGKYISSLNADDFYISHNLKNILQILQNTSPDALYANSIVVNEDGSFKFRTRPRYVNSWLMWHVLGCVTPETGFFISKEVYDEIGGFNTDFMFCQDYDIYIRLLKRRRSVYADIDIGAFQLSREHFSYKMQEQIMNEFAKPNAFGRLGAFMQKKRIDKLLRTIFGTQHYGNKIQGDMNRFVGNTEAKSA